MGIHVGFRVWVSRKYRNVYCVGIIFPYSQQTTRKFGDYKVQRWREFGQFWPNRRTHQESSLGFCDASSNNDIANFNAAISAARMTRSLGKTKLLLGDPLRSINCQVIAKCARVLLEHMLYIIHLGALQRTKQPC